VKTVTQAFMDETGALLFGTEHGAGLLIDDELDWALERMNFSGMPVDEGQLAIALSLRSGTLTALGIRIGRSVLPIERLDFDEVQARLGFVRNPAQVPLP
jgi:hypothetical protein